MIHKSKTTMGRRTGHNRPSKGEITRAALLDSAHQVFKTAGYYGASVSEITRRCGFSMGTFYRYFRNKEQVFLELNDLIVRRFSERVQAVAEKESDPRRPLRPLVEVLYRHIRENFAFHRILGEWELIERVTTSYYESIARHCRDTCRRLARAGSIRPLDPSIVAYGLIGICYFLSMDWRDPVANSSEAEWIDRITDLAMHGISGPVPWQPRTDWDQPVLPAPPEPDRDPVLRRGERTRRAILKAAGTVFGRHGLNQANISEITREAGIAQGTFYIHFKSKTELIEGFVEYINRKMRRCLQLTVADVPDRRDAEWLGMLAFFDFVLHHREIYRVVPESELIGRDIGRWYYERLAQGYSRRLQQGIEAGQIRNLPVPFLVRSLMGFTHFIGLRWIIWSARAQSIPLPLFKDIREFILFGLQPR